MCVINDWRSGVRTFHGVKMSRGVFEFVSEVLGEMQRQQGGLFNVPNCESLLAEMQSKINRNEITSPSAIDHSQYHSAMSSPTGPSRQSRKRLSSVTESGPGAVSYTHLTLPTILRV